MCLFSKKAIILFQRWLLCISTLMLILTINSRPVFCQVYGQEYPIGISVMVLPPYTPVVQQYFDDPNKMIITATNFTDSAMTVIFGGKITDNANISIYTDINHEPFHLVTIMPNSTFHLSVNNIQEVFGEEQLVYEGITEEQLIQDQHLPENDYWICITAYDPYTKMPLSSPEQGCSNVITVTMPGVALIIEPECGSNVVPRMPQNVSFSWIVPENAPPSTHYKLKINEIFPGENAHDALALSHPVFFETTVMTTSFILGPGEPPLIAGKNYAFVVISFDEDGNIIFENNGWSELCEFSVNYQNVVSEETDVNLNWEMPSFIIINAGDNLHIEDAGKNIKIDQNGTAKVTVQKNNEPESKATIAIEDINDNNKSTLDYCNTIKVGAVRVDNNGTSVVTDWTAEDPHCVCRGQASIVWTGNKDPKSKYPNAFYADAELVGIKDKSGKIIYCEGCDPRCTASNRVEVKWEVDGKWEIAHGKDNDPPAIDNEKRVYIDTHSSHEGNLYLTLSYECNGSGDPCINTSCITKAKYSQKK